MKKSEIVVGGFYKAAVNGRVVTVRVDGTREVGRGPWASPSQGTTVYDVTNLLTGRTTVFRSAMKFRGPATSPRTNVEQVTSRVLGGEKGVKVEAVPAVCTNEGAVDLTAPEFQLGTPECDARVASIEADDRAYDEIARRNASATPANYVSPGDDAPPPAADGKPRGGLHGPSPYDGMGEVVPDMPGPPPVVPPVPVAAVKAATGLAASLTRATAAPAPAPDAGTAPHLIVSALAGTGKTTTLVEGMRVMRGGESALTPSPQQKAVWDCMALSRGDCRTVAFVAFNKSIADELGRRVPQGCEALTMHSLGFRAVKRAFGNSLRVEDGRVSDIVATLVSSDLRELRRGRPVFLKGVEDLVRLCKMNLIPGDDQDELDRLVAHYDLDLGGERKAVFPLVPRVLERCKDVRADGRVDFGDMIWLPVVLDLPVYRYDVLLVDEVQDLNRCQQELAKRAGRRLVLCGDPNQAIYGFAGADSESMDRLGADLRGTGRGCVTLPLTVTRRCGRAIVAEARRVVPAFEAHESNGDGRVSTADYPVRKNRETGQKTVLPWEKTYAAQVRDGDFVICRNNAPLVNQCMAFLKRGVRANIQGRDVGRGLISLVTKLGAADIPDLTGKLGDWLAREVAKENAKRMPSESRLQALEDKHDCVAAFTDGAATPDEVVRKIEAVFTDDPNKPGVRMSSIHRAKGLEADTVYLLQPDGASVTWTRSENEWCRRQGQNLLYVAVTRSIRHLVYVS